MDKNSKTTHPKTTKHLVACLLLVAAAFGTSAAQTFKVPVDTGWTVTADSKRRTS